MAHGLVKGEGFAVDASRLEANASRYHGKPPNELGWMDGQRQKRAVAEYLAVLDAEAQSQDEGDRDDGGSSRAKARLPPNVSRQDALSERMSDAKVAIIVDATKAALKCIFQ
jgi:hypothetical protein